MKINKLLCVNIILLFVFSNPITGQIEKNSNGINRLNEFILFDDIIHIGLPTKNPTPEIGNFSFNWGNSFDTAVANEALLRIAYEERKRDWFDKQKTLIQKEIEKKLNKSFNNYDESKDALFLDSEYVNLFNNRKIPTSEYRVLRSNGFAITKKYSKDLLLLEKRKFEIEYQNNINNSFLEGFKVNGVDLKDIKNISSLNENWYKIENPLINNLVTTFINDDIYKKLNDLGVEFDNRIIRLKNNYYNSFDEWEQLNLIQFLLNYEAYKKLANCYVCINTNNPFYKFNKIDVTTPEVIKDYAINNRDGGYSFFSEIGRDNYIGWPASSSHTIAIKKRQEYQREKERRLNAIMNQYSIFKTKRVDFLVLVFHISNLNERQWLDDNLNRAKEMADYLGSLFLHSQQYGHYIYHRDIKPIIELEALNDNIILKPDIGKINNRNDLKYTHSGTHSSGNYKVFQMEDGSRIMRSEFPLYYNSDGQLIGRWTSETNSSFYWYIKPYSVGKWSSLLIKPHINTVDELELLFRLGLEDLGLALGRYVVPLEDLKVLFTGEDFDGVPTSRWLAAGLFLVEIVPGGKFVKVVKVVPSSIFNSTGKFLKAVNKVNGGVTKLVYNVVDGVITFGNRGQLAQVLGTLGTGHHAHHLIPWETGTLDIIQKAAKADKHFHLNEFLNGIPRLPALHLTGHDIYNSKIISILRKIELRNPNISPEDAYKEITNFAEYLKDLIARNNHLNSGQIANLINWP